MKTIISPGNSKIGKIPNVSLVPVRDCVNCNECKKDCYALKAYRQYPNVRKAWNNNSRLVRSNPSTFEGNILEYVARRKPKWFRWHVAGDFINYNHFGMACRIADAFPKTKFLAFTKAWDYVYPKSIPRNLSVVYSAFQGMAPERIPDDGLPRAYAGDCSNHGKRFEKALQCHGSCETCGVCWELARRQIDVRFDMH